MLKLKTKYFSDRYIATFYLFAFSIQILALEGWAISVPKVALMAITPFIWFINSRSLTKATLWGAAYMIATTFSLYLQWNNVRSSTLWYSLLFFLMFNMYYSLIYVKRAFTLDYFIKLIRILIFAYAICLVAQQALHLVGIETFPLLNTYSSYGRGFLAGNSLAIEPSQSARLLTVAMYVYLKLLEVKHNGKQPFMQLIRENKKTFTAFFYTMVTMGSGTAFVGLSILSLYFINRKYIFVALPIAAVLYYIAINIEYEPLQRFIDVAEASVEMDNEQMRQVDNSAASRTNIIFNTIKYFDISDPQLLFGHGMNAHWYNPEATLSAIYDYGLVSYICKLGLFFSCCWCGLFSLPVLMFVLLFSFNIGNIAYGWACLMMLATLKYFQTHRE